MPYKVVEKGRVSGLKNKLIAMSSVIVFQNKLYLFTGLAETGILVKQVLDGGALSSEGQIRDKEIVGLTDLTNQHVGP